MKAINFNEDWLFLKENETVKKKISLPHDAMLFEKRAPEHPAGAACGYFEGGIYYYEKRFMVPKEWCTQTVQLYFEGVYQNSTILLNGKEVSSCAYGYSAFLVPLTALQYGVENQIQVIVDNSKMPNSRWYTGSGIYRSVSLLIAPKQHITFQGVKITTKSYDPARILVETAHTGGTVEVEILEGSCLIARATGESIEFHVPDAELWSEEQPHLYQCRIRLKEDDEILDEVTESFGIRLIEYSNQGLFINGQEILLRGGCVHQDNGILGAKSYRKAEWRRVKILKEAGYNAIRSAHNPCSVEMMNACDFYGVYLIDETWDIWFSHKNRYDYADKFMENYRFDLKSMVEKDYNHPSVIMYSIGNEVAEPVEEKGLKLNGEMVAYLHELDESRPVTAGFNMMLMGRAAQGNSIYQEEGGRQEEGETQLPNSSLEFNMITARIGAGINQAANTKEIDAITSPAMDALDIAGYNYASGRYPLEGKCHPGRLIYGSETFPHDIVKNWRMVEKFPYLIGDFMWTAWDYLGEAGSGAWGYTEDAMGFEKPYPWLLADMGALDILGDPNGELFQAQAVWHRLEQPRIAVQPVNHPGEIPKKSAWRGTNAIPSWSFKGCEGNDAVVEVYHDAAKVELFCNGESIDIQKVEDCKAVFEIKYVPGTIKAVSYNALGQELGWDMLTSATGKTRVLIIPEEMQACAGDILYVPVRIVGENGVVECNDDRKLTVEVEGGELLGFGSANPRTKEAYVSGTYHTYYGKAMAVVKAGIAKELRIAVWDGTKQYVEAMTINQ